VATPEKALCDFLYLNPQYDTSDEIEALRLDSDVLADIFRDGKLNCVADRFGSHSLKRRIRMVKEVCSI
jgi:hypothetical protein